jgi:Tol biopolymer transport system component
VYWVDDVSARRELAWVSRDGKGAAVDTAWRGTFSTPVISPDGSRLAVALRDASSADVWIKRLAGGSAVKLTFVNKSNEEPTWTPDGRALTYLSGTTVASAVGDVVRQSADGSDRPTTLLHLDRPISEQTWSLTGDWLVVRTTTSAAGSGDILAVHNGQGSAVSVVATPYTEYSPTLSPDGKWLAYVSNETGRFEVFVVPFPDPGAGKRQISTRGGIAPRWSRRGGEIFYLDLQSVMMSAQVATSPTFSFTGDPAAVQRGGLRAQRILATQL